ALDDADLGGALVGGRSRLSRGLDRSLQLLTVRVLEGPQGSLHRRCSGDDIGGLPSVYRADRQHCGMQRIGAPADQMLQGDDHVSDGDDRVASGLRVGGVPAVAVDGDAELVSGRVNWTSGGGDYGSSQPGMKMYADHGQHIVTGEGSGAYQVLGPAWIGLLPGLQYREQRKRPRKPLQCPGKRDERRKMDVVAAGVSRAVSRRRRPSRALRDRQGVKLGAARDHRGVPVTNLDEAAAADVGGGGLAEGSRDPGGGALLVSAELGFGVQRTSEHDRSRQ